jgi:adenylate cyclase
VSAPRKLAAILAARCGGLFRLIGIDEEGTLKRLRKLRRELINPAVTLHAAGSDQISGNRFCYLTIQPSPGDRKAVLKGGS